MPHHDERPAIDALTALRILRDKILPQAQNKRLNDFNVRLRVHDAAIGRLAQIADSDSFGVRELSPAAFVGLTASRGDPVVRWWYSRIDAPPQPANDRHATRRGRPPPTRGSIPPLPHCRKGSRGIRRR